METWKQIKGFTDYEISNLGRVKRLKTKTSNNKTLKEKILTGWTSASGYNMTEIKGKQFGVHQLVAQEFLNHKIDKYESVVNHINFIRNDNRLENLEVVSARENCNKKHLKSTSKYVGVCWSKLLNKWRSTIVYNKKQYDLGCFELEEEANKYYENALLSIKNNKPIEVKRKENNFKNIYFDKSRNRWRIILKINGIKKHYGYFKTENEAFDKLKTINNEK
jgi:hypothetical protein